MFPYKSWQSSCGPKIFAEEKYQLKNGLKFVNCGKPMVMQQSKHIQKQSQWGTVCPWGVGVKVGLYLQSSFVTHLSLGNVWTSHIQFRSMDLLALLPNGDNFPLHV